MIASASTGSDQAEAEVAAVEASQLKVREQRNSSPKGWPPGDRGYMRKKFKGDPFFRDVPNVPCSCCEHPAPKPWEQRKANLGEKATSLMAVAAAARAEG